MTISANDYIPLNRVRDMLESSGVYEILCLKTDRVYIGQSKAIIWRASQHFHDLKANRHTNKALQRDWNDLANPDVFVFKVVNPMSPLDEKALFAAEMKEINFRRKHGIVLYNDVKITRVVEDSPQTKKEVKHSEPAGRDYGNKPYERKDYTWVVNASNATCSDCGIIGMVDQDLFKHDGELRCERCIDRHSRKMEEWLRKERERVARETLDAKRITSRFKMRWQIGRGSLENNMTLAIAKYVSKYGQFPTEAHFSQGAELPSISDIEIKYHRHTPPGNIDLPIPSKE